MNPEIKAEWVKRLRSGEYKQGFGALQTPDGRLCCLGVLSEIAVEQGVVTKTFSAGCRAFEYDGHTNYLPGAVSDWADLMAFNPRIEHDTASSLAGLNDAGESFETIADVIEAQL